MFMWVICFFISFETWLLLSAFSFSINNSKIAVKYNFKLFNALVFSVVIASIVMFYPMNREALAPGFGNSVLAFFLSAFNTVQLFVVRYSFSAIQEGISFCPPQWETAYLIWAASLFVMAPVATFGFVLSFFHGVSSYLKYLGSFFKPVYAFSELNEKSLCLARDIRTNHQRAVIVFANADYHDDNGNSELLNGSRIIRAICLKKDISVINFEVHSKKKPIRFFMISDDEDENLVRSVKLIEKYKARAHTDLYLFSRKTDSEIMMSSVGDDNQIKIRRINEVRSMVYNMLNDEGSRLFRNAVGKDGTKTISALIVGMGAHGTEMLKALSWFGQMDGYFIKINAFDKDPMAEQNFSAQAPELMSEKYNGVKRDGESQYSIDIHSGMDVDTKPFFDVIKHITDATYVFVALGSDERNIRTAVALRTYLERMGISPIIQSVVYDSQKKKMLKDVKNYKDQPYCIEWIGDIESSYSENVIMPSQLEKKALAIHLKHGKEENFWKYEYNYRSSMTSAIHMEARKACGIQGADKQENELTEAEKTALGCLEHRRWNAYMRTEGYCYGEPRNDLGKVHPDLCTYWDRKDKKKIISYAIQANETNEEKEEF